MIQVKKELVEVGVISEFSSLTRPNPMILDFLSSSRCIQKKSIFMKI